MAQLAHDVDFGTPRRITASRSGTGEAEQGVLPPWRPSQTISSGSGPAPSLPLSPICASNHLIQRHSQIVSTFAGQGTLKDWLFHGKRHSPRSRSREKLTSDLRGTIALHPSASDDNSHAC